MSSVAITGNAAGAGVFTLASPNSASSFTATLPAATTTLVGTDATQTLTNKTIQGGAVTSGTAVASTSGTSIDFTSIPSWVKRITVMFNGVSTSGTSAQLIQLGTSGGVVSTGYVSTGNRTNQSNVTGGTNSTAGFVNASDAAANLVSGHWTITNVSGNVWICSHTLKLATTAAGWGGGDVTLSATLDRVRITTVNGTDTFDLGSINILYEG
jgi:hypothetical protein